MDAHQAVLLKEIVTDAARSGACIFRTHREVSRTSRDGTTPQNRNTALATNRLTSPVQICHSTTDPPSWNRNQEITNPIVPFSPQWIRNAEKLKIQFMDFLQKIEVLNPFLVR